MQYELNDWRCIGQQGWSHAILAYTWSNFLIICFWLSPSGLHRSQTILVLLIASTTHRQIYKQQIKATKNNLPHERNNILKESSSLWSQDQKKRRERNYRWKERLPGDLYYKSKEKPTCLICFNLAKPYEAC